MAYKLFSSSLTAFEGEVENAYLRNTLTELTAYLGKRKLDIFVWDENKIAIPVKLDIDLPPLGNFDSLDIRKHEYVLIVFSLKQYPTIAPLIYTDRLDFPKSRLAHLYIAKNGKPPAFCIVRGSINEWYSNKRIKDIIIRTKNWLRDAAIGELTDNGEQFEPLRLEGYRGSVIFLYDEFLEIVQKEKSFIDNSNFALALFENTANESEFPSFKLTKVIEREKLLEELKAYLSSLKNLIENKSLKSKQYHFGYLIWSKDKTEFENYYVDLPRTWEAFKEFCENYSVDITDFENYIADIDFNFFKEIPVIVALKRPKQVIGYSSNIEFTNFYFELTKEDKKDKKIVTNIPVHFQSHNEPLSTNKAKSISGTYPHIANSIIIGCGALGSKIIMHFIRNGCTNLVLLDNDILSPHNLVRHALLPEYEGMNKALALSKIIKNTYRHESHENVISLGISGETFFSILGEKLLPKTEWIFDFTASDSFLNSLISYKNLFDKKVCRANISDKGYLGLLLFEGSHRNPRIDDLLVLTYSLCESEPIIFDWLKREHESNNSGSALINVGIGCNSETTILSDEVISTHAAFFAGVIKHNSVNRIDNSKGYMYLNSVTNFNEYKITSKKIDFEPLVVLHATNDPTWEIRFKSDILMKVKSEMGLYMPYETGGVFIGCVNYKTKTIHVTDIVTAPSDSQTSSACFYRGINGLPERVKEINENSGFQLGYVGEWHTHPFGPNNLSGIDLNTVKRFKKEFEYLNNPLPVFILISTPTNILPYVY